MQKKASNGKRIGAYVLDGLFMCIIMLVSFLISSVLGFLTAAVIPVLYFGISEGSQLGGSPGKYLCGLAVVDAQGHSLTYGKSFLRALCRVLSGMMFGMGYIIGLLDENGRAMHDRMTGTMVVERASAQKGTESFRRNSPASAVIIQARLAAVSGPFAGKIIPVPAEGIVIGRSRTECGLVFPEGDGGQGISRVHCKIQYDPQKQIFILQDLGSSYGTFLGNDTRVWQGQPAFLRAGEEFYMAERTVRFRVEISSV